MIKDLEAVIGYRFRNISLLQNALTHSSYANERWHNSLLSNERLEFLGDSVLSVVVANYLFHHSTRPEGELSRMRASMCQNGEDTEIQNGRKQHDRHHDLYPFFHMITPYKRMRDKKSIAWIFRFEKVDYAS